MERLTFRHLDRDWEASIVDARDQPRVRFRDAASTDPKTYEARVDPEELDDEDRAERELALRRGLESALVLDALADHETGLTAEEVARMTGMPTEAARDRLDVLDSVQPVLGEDGPERYRTTETAR